MTQAIHSIIIPAEAPLDLYKAAYVLAKIHNLRLCNFTFAYPNKGFDVRRGDVLLGLHIDQQQHRNLHFLRFHEVLEHYGTPIEYNFLKQLSDDLLYGFRGRDKTLVLSELMNFFDNYRTSIAELSGTDELLEHHVVHEVGNNCTKIVVQNPQYFLSPDERIVLFRGGYHYVVFQTGAKVGIQKNLNRALPSLSKFASDVGLDANEWFIHRKGHMIVSRDHNVVADCNVLIEKFIAFLKSEMK